jgi:cytochrome c2
MRRAALPLFLLLMACNRDRVEPPAPTVPVVSGNAERGRILASQYGCNVCHAIPGVDGPQGSLGPPLAGVATRPTISMAAVQNTPENLKLFIQNPAALNPQSAMPPIGLPDSDALDIAAYLGTLR